MAPLLSEWILRNRYRKVFPHVRGEVLDLGCGYSIMPGHFPDLPRYIGVDAADGPIAYLRDRYPHYEFFRCDLNLEELSIEGQFDTIILSAVLEHLKTPGRIFSQLSRYLKPDGRVLLTTPTPVGGWIHSLGARLGLFYREAQREHEAFYSFEDLRALVDRHGLAVVHFERFLFGGNQFLIAGHPAPAPKANFSQQAPQG